MTVLILSGIHLWFFFGRSVLEIGTLSFNQYIIVWKTFFKVHPNLMEIDRVEIDYGRLDLELFLVNVQYGDLNFGLSC